MLINYHLITYLKLKHRHNHLLNLKQTLLINLIQIPKLFSVSNHRVLYINNHTPQIINLVLALLIADDGEEEDWVAECFINCASELHISVYGSVLHGDEGLEDGAEAEFNIGLDSA